MAVKSLLSTEEKQHFSRQIVLSEIGEQGQVLLKQAKILIVGAGALGCPLMMYLTAAGIGEIGIVDGDDVDDSNLHRQVLYGVNDVGYPKVQVLNKYFSKQNPNVRINTFYKYLDHSNATEIISNYDLVADCTDNFSTRYLINDISYLLKKPVVFASLSKFEGQVTVFNILQEDGTRSANYRDLFPEVPSDNQFLNCAEQGVMGAVAGIMGCLQSNEVIKLVTKIGKSLTNRVWVFDALTTESYVIKYHAKKNNPLNLVASAHELEKWHQNGIKDCTLKEDWEIDRSFIEEWIKHGENVQLVDVRETVDEQKGGDELIHIPASKFEEHYLQMVKQDKVVLLCTRGIASKKLARLLREKYQLNNLYSAKIF